MEQNTYRIAPYEKEHWHWMAYAFAVTFMCWVLSDYVWVDMPLWVLGVVLMVSALICGRLRIRQRGTELFLSAEGIRVRNGNRETVPLTPWSAFECGYILEIVWYGRGRDRYADTYFLLSGKHLDQEALDYIALDLHTSKPCGIWKDYIAIQTKSEDNKAIRTAIGSLLPMKELCIDMDRLGETTEDESFWRTQDDRYTS